MNKTNKYAALFSLAALVVACGGGSPADAPTGPTELVVTDTVAGGGAAAASGHTLTVHYTGWLYSATAAGNRGAKFDSSVDRGEPFTFQLGVSNVIPGWHQGLSGMRAGGKRTLTIPSHLGYGSMDSAPNARAGSKRSLTIPSHLDYGSMGSLPTIPGYAGLVFDVELLQVK